MVFKQLSREEIVEMVDLMLARVSEQLKEKRITMEVTDQAKNLLAKRGFDPVLGARPLRRTIQREIEDQLSEKILYGQIGMGETVRVDVDGWDGESEGTDATFTFTTTSTDGADVPDELDGLDAMGNAEGTIDSGAGDVIDAAEAAIEEAALEEKYGESGSDSDDGSATPREPGDTDEKDA